MQNQIRNILEAERKRVALITKVGGIVYRAVQSGLLIKQNCEICNSPKSIAHHDDYSKPLSVKWLCRKHHVAHHRAIGWGYYGHRFKGRQTITNL